MSLLALVEELAHAYHRLDAVLQGGRDLPVHFLIGLAEDMAPLGVPDQHVPAAGVPDHERRNLAGESALLLEVHVLHSDGDLRAAAEIGHRLGPGRRREYHYFAVPDPGYACEEAVDEVNRLLARLVHLPVAGEYFSSCHDCFLPCSITPRTG